MTAPHTTTAACHAGAPLPTHTQWANHLGPSKAAEGCVGCLVGHAHKALGPQVGEEVDAVAVHEGAVQNAVAAVGGRGQGEGEEGGD